MMKQIVRYTLLFILLLVSAQQRADEIKVDYLTISDSAEPLQIKNDTGYSGIITDIVEKILKDHATIAYHEYPFLRLKHYILQQKFTNWIIYGSELWTNSPQSWRISPSHVFIAENTLITKKGFNFESEKSLYGKSVILIRGFVYPGLIDLIESGKVNSYRFGDYQAGIKGIIVNRGIGFVGMKTRILYTLKQLELNPDDFELHDISSIIPNYGIHLSFSREFPDSLFEYANKRLEELKKSGFVEETIKKYTE